MPHLAALEQRLPGRRSVIRQITDMADRALLDRVKRATVALAFFPGERPADPRKAPFVIIGSGFCIDARGVIVTCEHVISAFARSDIQELIDLVPEEDKKKELWPLRDLHMAHPQALFFDTQASKENVFVLPAPVETAVGKTNSDTGLLRVGRHAAFKNGYPYLEIEDYANVYEGMDVATCGFPLGNLLQEQLGTVTSSFTRGILSSIGPSAGAELKYVNSFQLDLTATFGNSDGPVFNWSTGKVFGILQGAPRDREGRVLHGIARAEPVYKVSDAETVARLLQMSVDDIGKAHS